MGDRVRAGADGARVRVSVSVDVWIRSVGVRESGLGQG